MKTTNPVSLIRRPGLRRLSPEYQGSKRFFVLGFPANEKARKKKSPCFPGLVFALGLVLAGLQPEGLPGKPAPRSPLKELQSLIAPATLTEAVKNYPVEFWRETIRRYSHDLDKIKNRQGDNLLHLAVWAGRTDLSRLLLEAGLSPRKRNQAGNPPLKYACYRGHVEMVELLEEYLRPYPVWSLDGVGETNPPQVDPGRRDKFGQGPFIWLLQNPRRQDEPGYQKLLKYYRRLPAEIYLVARNGENGLHLAVKRGQGEQVVFLLKTYDDLGKYIARRGGLDPMVAAIKWNRPDLLAQLLKAGVPPDRPGPVAGDRPLHWACRLTRPSMARRLLEYGALPNWKNQQGETARQIARRRGLRSVLKIMNKTGGG